MPSVGSLMIVPVIGAAKTLTTVPALIRSQVVMNSPVMSLYMSITGKPFSTLIAENHALFRW